jgi:endoglucanase
MRVLSVRRTVSVLSVLAAASSVLKCSQSNNGSLDGGGQDASVTPESGETSVKSSTDGGPSSDGGSRADSGAATDASAAPDSHLPIDSGAATDSHAPVDSGAATDSGVATDSSGSTDGGALSQLTVVGNHFEDPSGNKVILRGVSIEGLSEQSQESIGLNGIIEKITNKNDPASMSPGWYTRIVRLPVDPNGGNSSETWTSYVNTLLKPAVDDATAAGLYAIVDLHYVDDPYNLVDPVNTFWTTVAPIFKDYTNVFYEVFNESNQTDTWADYKPTMQAWVNLIRSYAPNNVILAGSPAWDQTMGDTATDPLTGTNIAYTVHMYEQHYATASLRAQVEQAAAVNAVVMTEWGFCDCSAQPGLPDLVDNYGTPMLTWLEGMNGGWTAWCASISWLPDMFGSDWTLLDTPYESQMGGFVKDWMYTHRNQSSAP